MLESNSFFYYFPVFSIFWQWICITLIIRGSIILLKVESQLFSFCVYVMGILIWPASFSPSPAPWHGPWSLTSIFVMGRTSSWKFFLARRERRYLKLEMLEKAFWSLSAHRCWLTLNFLFPYPHSLSTLTLFMWNVQVTHYVCRFLQQVMGSLFFDLQAMQYNYVIIFNFLYFVDVTLNCTLREALFFLFVTPQRWEFSWLNIHFFSIMVRKLSALGNLKMWCLKRYFSGP